MTSKYFFISCDKAIIASKIAFKKVVRPKVDRMVIGYNPMAIGNRINKKKRYQNSITI